MGVESKLESDLRKYAESRGVDFIKLTIRKYPDRLLLGTRGRLAYMELKKPRGRYRPGQKEKLAELRRRGFIALRVDNFEFGAFIIDLLVDRND